MRKTLALFLLVLLSPSLLFANSADNGWQPYKSKTELLLLPRSDNMIGLTAYDQNYLMETFSNGNFYDQKDMKHDEVKFQISLALPIWRHILGENSVLAGSYTQRSWFQLSNTANSSPFRETNYEPQLFLAWATNYTLPFGWTLNDVETGFNHQSNGKSDEQLKSRSWNRLYARASASKGNWIVEIKPWWRIPEKSEDDDNPDITHYRGYFDLSVGYQYHKHQIKFTGHYNPRYNKGGLEVAYSYPITKYIRFYTQYYGGYGESLIDYNRNIQRIGIGISLNNVF
ncbi:phospholipase A1 [Volucribacter psittacicida]|uniref:Phospholipase A1 n=1 Tax=Volucribacter psittacicida TaxID=203482 RepID=A0A4R1FYD0_9PAST|nr:phospholipase A [Volucribacter psittacicida]TCJ98862.1 phospholipase A1 [Volucribacter psittacicida]